VPEQQEEQNNRNWNSEQPQQYAFSHHSLSRCRRDFTVRVRNVGLTSKFPNAHRWTAQPVHSFGGTRGLGCWCEAFRRHSTEKSAQARTPARDRQSLEKIRIDLQQVHGAARSYIACEQLAFRLQRIGAGTWRPRTS
jgi:hypothetical protein